MISLCRPPPASPSPPTTSLACRLDTGLHHARNRWRDRARRRRRGLKRWRNRGPSPDQASRGQRPSAIRAGENTVPLGPAMEAAGGGPAARRAMMRREAVEAETSKVVRDRPERSARLPPGFLAGPPASRLHPTISVGGIKNRRTPITHPRHHNPRHRRSTTRGCGLGLRTGDGGPQGRRSCNPSAHNLRERWRSDTAGLARGRGLPAPPVGLATPEQDWRGPRC